eukprot:PhM_4_TR16426/c0_g1_i1/m.36234/K14512/MPK6; mitogen-activated protein kinase 6
MSQPKGMRQSQVGVSAPVDAPNGRKIYTVLGNSIEVPPHYTVTKAVGYGSYGFVCAAVDTRTNSKVAIKKCQSIFKDMGDAKRILREIQLLRFIDHGNLCGVRSVFAPEQKSIFRDVYLVFELFDTDLNTVIRSKQQLEEEHMKYFVYQILCGLKYLHSGRVMHRDLKPANLLVNLNCDLKICDFGLARGFKEGAKGKLSQELTEYVVTRWYRPPELLMMSSTYTTAVDIWSAGCIMAEISNRRALFPGKDYLNQLSLICDVLGTPNRAEVAEYLKPEAAKYLSEMPAKAPKKLAELVPNVREPGGIDFLSKMLSFDPRSRPTADELLKHPYMSSLHDEADEPGAGKFFEWVHEEDDLNEQQLRDLFWKDVCDYSTKEGISYKN